MSDKTHTIIFLLFLTTLLVITYAQAGSVVEVQDSSSGCRIEQKMDFVLLDRKVTFDTESIVLNSSVLSMYNMSPEDIFVRDSLIKRMTSGPAGVVTNGTFVIQVNITLADRWDKVAVYNKTVC